MRLQKLHIQTRFKNIENLEIDFTAKDGLTVLIGNNGSGKSNILEALSSVFAGLYNAKYSPSFNYFLKYTADGKEVIIVYRFDTQLYTLKVNGVEDNIKPEYLPSRVIANYSGEESRLWKAYYQPFYDDYIQAIKGATLPNLQLVFINKYYWDIALLTLHFYDFSVFTDIRDFCQKEIGITQVNTISFNFDVAKIATYEQNPVVNFVKSINPRNEASLTLTLAELKGRLAFITNEIEFFNYLTAAFMPKDHKLITQIEFNFNQNLTTQSFSEGEKKLILVKLILEVIGDENALILLDEPDSHIHISRKQDLQKLINNYTTRENILTTHSPTLTHCFESKHIVMLNKNNNNDVGIEQQEKQEIIHQLTDGIWSYQQQNIFLSSNNDILLVEGKTDISIIKEAIKKLDEYKSLENLEFIPTGGASGLRLFIDKFTAKDNQRIIGVLDKDKAGNDEANEVLTKAEQSQLKKNGFAKLDKRKNTFVLQLPKLDRISDGQFEIEDYFKTEKLLNIATTLLEGKKVLKDFNLDKKIVKNALNNEMKNYDKQDFEDFRILLDLILKIKGDVQAKFPPKLKTA